MSLTRLLLRDSNLPELALQVSPQNSKLTLRARMAQPMRAARKSP